jgi:hypothetical protein
MTIPKTVRSWLGGKRPCPSSSISGTGPIFRPQYAYDFGDDWQHILVHEGLEPVDRNCKYPRCVAGEGRCPPEDCGGVHGYAEVLQVIANPDHEGHASMLEWAGGHFDPHAFDPSAVKFDDPAKRWKKAFGLGRMR